MHERGHPGQGYSPGRSGTRGLLGILSLVRLTGSAGRRPSPRRRRRALVVMSGALAGGLVISMVSAASPALSAVARQAGTASAAHGPGPAESAAGTRGR